MIKAQKHSLEWQLAQGKVAALTRELDFLIDGAPLCVRRTSFTHACTHSCLARTRWPAGRH